MDERYLVGDTFTVADLTAAALFHPIVRPAEAQYELPDRSPRHSCSGGRRWPRPGFRWVQEMYHRHRGRPPKRRGTLGHTTSRSGPD